MASRLGPWLAMLPLAAAVALAQAPPVPRTPGGRLGLPLPLVITELNYHPPAGGAEFAELKNLGAQPLDLSGIHFSDGIEYRFPPGSTLLGGGYALLAASAEEFAVRYPGVAIAGVYEGRLDNAGELLVLSTPAGAEIVRVAYNDAPPWPVEPDGGGASLVLGDPFADSGDPFNWCASAAPGGSPGAEEPGPCPPRDDPTQAMFDPERVLEVAIELDPADWEALRRQERNIFDLFAGDCLAEPFASPFTYFAATVTVEGVAVEQVGVRKKGFLGSLSQDKPSLKISFDEYVDGQRLAGMRRMTLNNCRQDPSYLKQCLGYQLFAEAGVPAPRCSFALLTVNGEELGLYAHVESVEPDFLARHFARDDGTLWEGTLSDFRSEWIRTFDQKTNRDAPDRTALEDVMAAVELPDEEMAEVLTDLLDLDAFLDFWAMEVILGHGDGYAGNANNFFVYHDPASDRLRFVPWGIDAILFDDNPSGSPSGATGVLAVGVLARRLYLHAPSRANYVARVLALLDRVWDEDRLLAEVGRMAALVEPYLDPEVDVSFHDSVDRIRDFAAGRKAALEASLFPEPPPWTEPLRDPFCFELVGEVSATFSTTWDTLDTTDIFQSGSGTFTATVRDQQVTALAVGAAAGPGDETNPDAALVLVAAYLPDGTFAILYLETSQALATPGADLPLDMSSADGLLLHLDPVISPEPQIVGILGEGVLHFGQASTTPGAVVSGSVQSPIWEPFF